MTRAQRAQVVELLRCTADRCQSERNAGIYGTATDLGYRFHKPAEWHIKNLAVAARVAANDGNWEPYEDTCLEAAARVEQGEWP